MARYKVTVGNFFHCGGNLGALLGAMLAAGMEFAALRGISGTGQFAF